LKKCEDIEGRVCDKSKGMECSIETIESFDEAECCLDECEAIPCFGVACPINKKCEEDECVLKTCDEMGGVGWLSSDRGLCKGRFYEASEQDCCVEMECDELNGSECQGTESCSGEVRRSTDVAECCIGTCQ